MRGIFSARAVRMSSAVTQVCNFPVSSTTPLTTLDGNIVDDDNDDDDDDDDDEEEEMIFPVEYDLRGLVNKRGGNFVFVLLPRWLPMLLMWRSLPAVIDDDRTRDGWFELNCGYLWSKLRCELSMLLLLLPWRYVGRLRTCPLLILFPLLQLRHSVSPEPR